MRHIAALSLLTLATGCGLLDEECALPPIFVPQLQPDRVSITEGIWGQVSVWEGDFTPGDLDCPRGSITTPPRWILVFEPTTDSARVLPDSASYVVTKISTMVIDSVRSDETGFFEVSLPAGDYSVFVREGDRLYWDGIGIPYRVLSVPPGATTAYDLQLTHNSTS